VVFPRGCFEGPNRELVIVKENSYGLDPREISLHVVVSSAYEVGVYVEVGIGYEAEVSLFLSMEVERDSIATNESRILANSSWSVTLCQPFNTKLVKNVYFLSP